MGIIKILLGLILLCVIVLGVHGLYVYFNPISFISDSYTPSGNALQDVFETVYTPSAMYEPKLFGSIPMKGFLGDITNKVSEWGLQSWFMPTVLVAVGVLGIMLLRKI